MITPGRNVLIELRDLFSEKGTTDRIVQVVSHDHVTNITTYTMRGSPSTSTFVSTQQYTPGDDLIMNGDNVIGLAEPISNTIWID